MAKYQCHKVARYTYHRPTYLLAPKNLTKTKGNTKKPISRERKSLKKFLKSRQEIGPKGEEQNEQQD